MRLSFLFDECLTPSLKAVSENRGFFGVHVRERDLTKTLDPVIARYCVDHDLIMVTNNFRDFRAIYQRLEVHPGLVVILPSVPGPAQQRLFDLALDRLCELSDAVNTLVQVDEDGQVTVSDLPEPSR